MQAKSSKILMYTTTSIILCGLGVRNGGTCMLLESNFTEIKSSKYVFAFSFNFLHFKYEDSVMFFNWEDAQVSNECSDMYLNPIFDST